MLSRLTARNLRLPRGLFGRLTARLMNRANARMNQVTMELLDVRPGAVVLDVGFGGGLTLRPLVERARGGRVVGVDPSPTMLASARARHRDLLADGRLELARGSVETLPLADRGFDRVCTVNTLYFWERPEQGAREIHRVLRPGGKLVLSFRPPEAMRRFPFVRHGFRIYEPDEVEVLLAGAGFAPVRTARGEDDGVGYACAVAERP